MAQDNCDSDGEISVSSSSSSDEEQDPAERQRVGRERAQVLVAEAAVLTRQTFAKEHPTGENATRLNTGRATPEAMLEVDRLSRQIIDRLEDALAKDPQNMAATLALEEERQQASPPSSFAPG